MSTPSLTTPASPPDMVPCTVCTAQIAAIAPYCPQCGAPNPSVTPPTSDKTVIAAVLLCFFLGTFGAHRFYVGRIHTGLLTVILLALPIILASLAITQRPSGDEHLPITAIALVYLSFVGMSLWSIIDLVLIAVGSYRDVKGLPLKR